jgi:hypothetical protein
MNDTTEELLHRALEATEEALSEVTKLAIERIRLGADNPPHLEAAERDLRNALRQLAILSRTSPRSPRARERQASEGATSS